MGAITELKLPAIPAVRWRLRHKKLHFMLITAGYVFFGGFAGMFVAMGLKANVWLAAGLIVFGLLFGLLTGSVCFLMERICFPEESGKQP